MVETNLNVLRLEYDAGGNYVPPRPNAPSLAVDTVAITNGRDLSVQGKYPTDGETGVATQLQLFSRTDTGSYDFSTPEATAALAAGIRSGVKTATLTLTFPGDGPRWICLKAATAGGVQGPQSNEVLIDPSTAAVPAPTEGEAFVSRG